MVGSSKELAKLCCTVIYDVYGEVASVVLLQLLTLGRLPLRDLIIRTEMKQQELSVALVSLVQNRFVLHRREGNVTYYTANPSQIYHLLSMGEICCKFGSLVGNGESNHEQNAREIIKNLIVYGHIQFSDYLNARTESDHEDIKKTITKLVQQRLLRPLIDSEFEPLDDFLDSHTQQRYLEKLKNRRNDSSVNESKLLLEAKKEAQQKLEEVLATRDDPDWGLESGTLSENPMGMKSILNGRSSEKLTISSNAVLAVNFDKFLVLQRNEELVKFVHKRIGRISAKVYEALLQLLSKKIQRCSQNLDKTSQSSLISTREIVRVLDEAIPLANAFASTSSLTQKGLKRAADNSNLPPQKRLKTEPGTGDDFDEEEDDDDSDDMHTNGNGFGNGSSLDRTTLVRQHLELIASSPFKLVEKINVNDGGQWYVPFAEAGERVKEIIYEELITSRCGKNECRILRVLKEFGRVDEKQLSQIALLDSRDIRECLAKLSAINGADLQEVPRTNDRAAGRGFYLWFHQSNRAYDYTVEELYKTMNNLYRRFLSEREAQSTLLAKLAREDVQGHEDEYLTKQERVALSTLEKKEEKLLVQIMRINRLVRIFRDY